MSSYLHRRTPNAPTAFPTLQPGEIAVNTANLQIAVGDANASTSGTPLPLLGLRVFSTNAQYAAGDIVVYGGNIYRANAAITPGAFTPSQWTSLAPGDAPSDGTLYGRKNAAWATIPIPAASVSLPLMDGTAAAGSGTAWAGGDHVHPSDTSRAALAGAAFTGAVTAPTPATADNSTRVATTAYVTTAVTGIAVPAPSATAPLMDGAAAVGTSPAYARGDHVHPSDTSRAPLASPAFTGTPTAPTVSATDNSTNVATTAFVHSLVGVVPSYLTGLTLSTAGNSITYAVASGTCTDSTNVETMTLSASISKTTAPWSAGSAVGSLDTGSIVINTWYHVYLIKRLDTGVVDVLISLSAPPLAPTLPPSYTRFRRIGSVKTNASSQWTGFVQFGDEFLWTTPVEDVANLAIAATTNVLHALSVPSGLQVTARMRVGYVSATASAQFVLTSPDDSSSTTAAPVGNITIQLAAASPVVIYATLNERTNTTGQIRAYASAAGTWVEVTYGWIDRRGRDS